MTDVLAPLFAACVVLGLALFSGGWLLGADWGRPRHPPPARPTPNPRTPGNHDTTHPSTAAADAANTRVLEAHRRAVLAEHRGQVIDELVVGSTPEEIDASVTVATAAYTRAVEAARAQLAATQVPPGASTHNPAAETENL